MGFTDVFFCPMLANDLGTIFLKMLEAGLSGLYHAVSSECLSKYEFGVRLARRFGLDEQPDQPYLGRAGGLKAARSPNLTLRTDKLAQALWASLSPDVSTGLERFYTQYQQGYPQDGMRDMAGTRRIHRAWISQLTSVRYNEKRGQSEAIWKSKSARIPLAQIIPPISSPISPPTTTATWSAPGC